MKHKSHLGVYAVALNPAQTHILAIRKARGPYTGRYDLPGGSMEDGELLEDTLQREVMEETGCRVESFAQRGAVSTLFDYTDTDGVFKRFRHIGVLYDIGVSGSPIRTGDGQDSHGAEWLALADMTPENSSPFLLMARERK